MTTLPGAYDLHDHKTNDSTYVHIKRYFTKRKEVTAAINLTSPELTTGLWACSKRRRSTKGPNCNKEIKTPFALTVLQFGAARAANIDSFPIDGWTQKYTKMTFRQ